MATVEKTFTSDKVQAYYNGVNPLLTDWTNPQNAKEPDNLWATISTGAADNLILWGFLGLASAIPSDATILGITANVRGHSVPAVDYNGYFRARLYNYNSTTGMGSQKNGGFIQAEQDQDNIFGGPSDLWGSSANLVTVMRGGGFGIGVNVLYGIVSRTWYLNNVELSVRFSYPERLVRQRVTTSISTQSEPSQVLTQKATIDLTDPRFESLTLTRQVQSVLTTQKGTK